MGFDGPGPPRSSVQGLNLSDSTGGQCLHWASPHFSFPAVGTERGAPGGKQSRAGSHQGRHPSRGGNVGLPKAGRHQAITQAWAVHWGLRKPPWLLAEGMGELNPRRVARARSKCPWWPVGAGWPHGCWAGTLPPLIVCLLLL